jgi:hypothetical protein
MQLPASAFTTIDWSSVEATRHPGDAGEATWRTVMLGDIRIRRVDYSPGYVANHWCDRGHILFVIEGEMETELKDGRKHRLTAGMSYLVSDFGDPAHRSSTAAGAQLFMVD